MELAKQPPHVIRIAHSPDPDDQFMFWPLREGLIPGGRFQWEWSTGDTQSLNELASRGGADVVAVSAAHFVELSDRYAPLKMGSSVGRNYGPVLVAPVSQMQSIDVQNLQVELHIARKNLHLLSPGPQTTAQLVLNLLCGSFAVEERVSIVPMRAVFDRLKVLADGGTNTAALLIHEGRLTYTEQGCVLLMDIGKAWHQATGGLPLPLGINVIRSDFPATVKHELASLFRQSFLYAQEHRAIYGQLAVNKQSRYFSPLNPVALQEYLDLYANASTLEPASDERLAFSVLRTCHEFRKIKTNAEEPLSKAEWQMLLTKANDALEWI